MRSRLGCKCGLDEKFSGVLKKRLLHTKGQSCETGLFYWFTLESKSAFDKVPHLAKEAQNGNPLIDNRRCLFNLLGDLSNIGTVSAKAHASLSASPSDKNAMVPAHAIRNTKTTGPIPKYRPRIGAKSTG